MSPIWPLFITVFLSIFHLLGGGAVGHGLRAALRGSDKAMFFVLWGAGMGAVPLVFDWFFLIAQGHLIYGFVGPVLFIIAFLASAFLELKIEGGAIISAALGSVAMLLGILSIPLMLDAAKTADPGLEDYLFGSCFVLLFVVIGGVFALNGFSAIFHSILLEQGYGEREQKPEAYRKRKQDSSQLHRELDSSDHRTSK